MKTIAFYSYKGGTGRSLTVAQLSVLLARFGKRVVVLDFDFAAPGLPFKYKSIFEWFQIPQLGLLELLKSYRQTKVIPNLETKPISAIPDLLDVFPAGNPFTPDFEYWNTYTNPEMQSFLATKSDCDDFFEKLKETIARTYPTAEFLLIDTPSGVSRLAAIAIQLLADTLVCLSANHTDGLLGTNVILKDLQNKERQGIRVPSKWYFVLSRIPDYHVDNGKLKQTSEEQLERIQEDVLRLINQGLQGQRKIARLFPLRSEYELELREHLPIPLRDSATLLIAEDYVELFSALVPELEENFATLRTGLRKFRPFLLIPDQGLMINPEDDSLNVALRVDTFISTFSSIVESIRKMGGSIIASDVLFKAGYDAAERFSTYLSLHWRKESKNEPVAPLAKLAEWCEFDSTVGFGKFAHSGWGTAMEGKIELTNNFLIFDQSKNDPNLCSFMAGYVSRVLGAIFEGAKVTVTHDLERECGQYKDDSPPKCIFRYLAETPAAQMGAS